VGGGGGGKGGKGKSNTHFKLNKSNIICTRHYVITSVGYKN
jgi:hypothetical protein